MIVIKSFLKLPLEFILVLINRIKTEVKQLLFSATIVAGFMVLFVVTFLFINIEDLVLNKIFIQPLEVILIMLIINPLFTSSFMRGVWNKVDGILVERVHGTLLGYGYKRISDFGWIIGFYLFATKYVYLLYSINASPDSIKEVIYSIAIASLVIAIIDTFSNVQEKKHLSEECNEMKRHREVADIVLHELKGSIDVAIESSITKVSQISSSEITPEKKYTNTEFGRHSIEFIRLYDSLTSYILELKKLGLTKIHYNNGRYERDSKLQFVLNHKKGFDGEELVKKTLIKDKVKFYESVNLKNNGVQIEVDFMVITGDTIVTLEVKDFKADEVVLDNSGEFYRVKDGEKEKIEGVLSQVNRHRYFIRENFPEGMNIINLIVLSDRKTTVINKMNSDKLKVVIPDFVVNVIDDVKSTDRNKENDAVKVMNELLTDEREFDFFDIENEIHEMNLLLEDNINAYKSLKDLYSLDYDNFTSSIETRHLRTYKELYDESIDLSVLEINQVYPEIILPYEFINSNI